MERHPYRWGIIFGGATAIVVMGLNYLGSLLAGLPQAAFSLFDFVARILPGDLITLGIDSMVSAIEQLNLGATSEVAKNIEQSMAIVQFILLGMIFGLVIAALGRRSPGEWVRYGLVAGLVLAIGLIAVQFYLLFPPAGPVLSLIWIALVVILWGAVLGGMLKAMGAAGEEEVAGMSRRQFLYLAGIGSFTILVTAAGVSILEREGEELAATGDGAAGGDPAAGDIANQETTSGPAQSPPQEVLDSRIEPVQGTRAELTPNEEFYRIDINTFPPTVEEAGWQLEVGGLVDNPLTLTLADIRSRPAVSQAITLECISNRIGGDLIGASLWTGVRLRDLLEEAGLQEGVQEIYIESVDGFHESVPLEEAMDERTLLVYEMNGEPLPREHGFPLRIYIPNHFGMKQPKWIVRMEAIDHEGPGYWVSRGWSEEAIVKTTSVIDTVGVDFFNQETGLLPVGGIAYAGARGISKVEVQVDDGEWQEAELRDPPLSPLTWVQWRYEWPAEAGRHTFRVRAYDGTGELQETEEATPHPDGATGIHEVSDSTPG